MAFGGINVTAPEGLEADDVIATFAQTAVEQVRWFETRGVCVGLGLCGVGAID